MTSAGLMTQSRNLFSFSHNQERQQLQHKGFDIVLVQDLIRASPIHSIKRMYALSKIVEFSIDFKQEFGNQ